MPAKERKSSAAGPPNTSKGLKTKDGPTVHPFLGLTPRTHNILSYATTSLLFTLALLTLLPSGLDGMTSGQAVILFYWNIHFVRRTAEAAFVHVFSKSHVPFVDTVVELVYYWLFAITIAWEVSTMSLDFAEMPTFGLRVFAVMEICNAKCHWMLRDFRLGKKTSPRVMAAYVMPTGFLFDWVSCPHYTCEILAWVGFAGVVRSLGSIVFALLGAIIMCGYAKERHMKYRKQFPEYPAGRGMLVPLDRFVV